ncbi:cytochrome P450 9e2-like [Prorops nasuta]|uniref:cytochrome P450 9e2-like n=1 Tax=Prorops nasuta TaxID=863751 RepID=UPI0034D01424
MEGRWLTLLLLVTLLLILLIKVVAIIHHQYTYWSKRGVPTETNCPLFGSTWRFIFQITTPAKHVNNLYYSYPGRRCIGGMDFAMPILIIRDPELIKDIAVKNFDNCPNHRTFVDEEMDPIFGKNVFSLKDERWKEMRNTLTPSFTASKMRIMFDLVSNCAKGFVDYLVDCPPGLLEQLDTKDAFTRYTNDVIATAAFGITVNSMKNRENEFYVNGKDVASFTGIARLAKFILMRSMPRLTRFFGLTFLSASATRFLKNVLTETVRTREQRGIVRPDMIQLLMQAREKDGSGYQMTMDDIIAQGFIFFLAGFDTSSSFMCFMALELAFNRDIQERLRLEVDQLIESKGSLTYEDMCQMTYMDMVISETLRKYPPLLIIDRECSRPFEIPASGDEGAIVVEKGTVCVFPAYSLQNDPKYFPHPDKFDPERFNERNKENITPYFYMPFGIGPRKCIGNRFALMEIKLIMAYLLQRFVLKTNQKSGTMPVTFSKKQFNLIPEGGFWLTLEKRV